MLVFYCDDCKMVCDQEMCHNCGKKRLKQVEAKDFCFLTEIRNEQFYFLETELRRNKIPFVSQPFGNGARTALGLNLENQRVFVPYEFLQNGQDILSKFENEIFKQNLKILKENIDKLFLNKKIERKLRKNLKLDDEINILDFCKKSILNSKNIVDSGRISSCVKGGHYFIVEMENLFLTVNSATMEILNFRRKN